MRKSTLLAALAAVTVPSGFTGGVSLPIAGHGTGFPVIAVVNGVYEGPGGPITLKQSANAGGTTQPKGAGSGNKTATYYPVGTLTAASSGLSRLQEATAHTAVPSGYTGYVKVQLPNGQWTDEYVVHGTFDGVELAQSSSAGGTTLNGVYIPSSASQSASVSAYTSAAANPDPFIAALHSASVPSGYTGSLTLHLSDGRTTTIGVFNGVYDGAGGPYTLKSSGADKAITFSGTPTASQSAALHQTAVPFGFTGDVSIPGVGVIHVVNGDYQGIPLPQADVLGTTRGGVFYPA